VSDAERRWKEAKRLLLDVAYEHRKRFDLPVSYMGLTQNAAHALDAAVRAAFEEGRDFEDEVADANSRGENMPSLPSWLPK